MHKINISRFILGLLIFSSLLLMYSNCAPGFKEMNSEDLATNRQTKSSSVTSFPTPTVSPTPTPVSFSCKPPRHYVYTLQPGDEKFLSCTPTSTDVFRVNIPDQGYAIGRSTLIFRNNHSQDIYFWSVSVVVGDGTIAYAQGDDVCPNKATPVKRSLGYGHLSSANNSLVRVSATQGSSNCINAQIGVFSGGTLDVWVEDDDPRCQKKDIQMISSYNTIGTSKYYWNTSMKELLSLNVPASTDRTKLLVLGAVEGSPESNPNNTCGSEAASLVAQLGATLYGAAIDTQQDVIPASQGMGHLVLAPQALISYSSSVSKVSLLVGSNTGNAIFTNDCCGDGKLGFVKQP